MVCSATLEVGGAESEPRGSGILMASKFHPPDPRREWVSRHHLARRLGAEDAKLALVHAPAGFGKTIAVSQWRAAEIPGRAFAWVSLDPGDDDPVRLWSHIVSSLQRACPSLAGEDLLALLRVRVPDISGQLVPSLVNALAGLRERVVLVLDDFHLVGARRCHEQIESLLASLLPPAKIVIISRTVPPFQVARLRAAGEMTEIGMCELRFTPEEAARLISSVAGRPLGQCDLAELVERTEGWPAALYLAALSLRSQPDPGVFVHEFTRGNRYVADYLLEEVISRQPEHIIRFLTDTAILDRFTAALCNAVTARRDAAEIIDMLERENLFLVALDESRQWFRYHHLFCQALRARLASAEPTLVPLLHQRASEWFRTHGSPEEAIGHALAAGDTDVAVEVMAAHWYSYVNVGRMETVSGWLKALGDRILTVNPLAAHTAAWIAALSGQSGTVQRLLPVIDAGEGGGPLPDGMRSLRSSAALLRAMFGFDGIRVMRESAATAVKLEDDPASPWHVLALTVHGFSLYLSGEPGAAHVLRRAVLSGVADPVIRLAATSIAAVAAIAEGRLAEGKVLADEALRSAEDGLRNAPQASLAYTAVASGWAEEGRLEEARRELLRALQSRRRWLEMSPWPTLEIMFRLAAVLHGMGDDAGAATLVTEIDDALTSLPDGAEAQRARLELLGQRLGIAPGTEPTVEGQALGLTAREMTVLRMLRGTMSIPEIAQELRLSSNTIKTHNRAIYRKLGVSARPAAVTRARGLGLLLPGPERGNTATCLRVNDISLTYREGSSSRCIPEQEHDHERVFQRDPRAVRSRGHPPCTAPTPHAPPPPLPAPRASPEPRFRRWPGPHVPRAPRAGLRSPQGARGHRTAGTARWLREARSPRPRRARA
jgi:ATP/maltotriose-dependent transcriptional regulator MalT